MFQTYLNLGLNHIADVTAYDHILFIVALCAVYKPSAWKQIIILVTAFTIGHSLTLALAALEIIRFPARVIEFLIPVTILITALYNVINPPVNTASGNKFRLNYFFALFFGLIHGMGFSNFLRSVLMPGEESKLIIQLLAFNIGIEIGQLIIVAVFLLISAAALVVPRIKHRDWTVFVSGGAAGIALLLIKDTWLW